MSLGHDLSELSDSSLDAMSAFGPQRRTPDARACPQLAKADAHLRAPGVRGFNGLPPRAASTRSLRGPSCWRAGTPRRQPRRHSPLRVFVRVRIGSAAPTFLPISRLLDTKLRSQMTALPALTIEQTDLALPAADIEAAAAFARNEKAPATRAAYRSDFAMFRKWCQGKGVSPLPASPAPFSPTRPIEDPAQRRSRAAAPPSATPTGSPTWSRRPIPSTSAPRSAASAAPSVPPRRGRRPPWPRQPAPWPFPLPRASRASGTARCYCWASQARCAGPSWWPSMSPTLRKPRTGSRSSSAGRRPTRKATASRSPSRAA
jgi:hypothetical protein